MDAVQPMCQHPRPTAGSLGDEGSLDPIHIVGFTDELDHVCVATELDVRAERL